MDTYIGVVIEGVKRVGRDGRGYRENKWLWEK